MDDRIVARVDLKSDRQAGILLVKAAHPEKNIPLRKTADALAAELRTLADWLGLERVKVARKGRLARELASSCK
jgi:uncharacterized protein